MSLLHLSCESSALIVVAVHTGREKTEAAGCCRKIGESLIKHTQTQRMREKWVRKQTSTRVACVVQGFTSTSSCRNKKCKLCFPFSVSEQVFLSVSRVCLETPCNMCWVFVCVQYLYLHGSRSNTQCTSLCVCLSASPLLLIVAAFVAQKKSVIHESLLTRCLLLHTHTQLMCYVFLFFVFFCSRGCSPCFSFISYFLPRFEHIL